MQPTVIPYSDLACPLLFDPKMETLSAIRVCRQFDPKRGLSSAVLAGYQQVEVVALKSDLLYALADSHLELKTGQYLRRSQWLEEQLESEEPVYMLYDTLADLIIGSHKTKGRYRMVEVPRFRELGAHARALVWQSYCGRTKSETALAMEAFVLAQPATMDDELADALDTAYLLISDRDTSGRTNRRRKTLMAEAVLRVADERLTRIDEAMVEVEECVLIGLDRMKQITEHLMMVRQAIGNRLHSAPDIRKLSAYAIELRQLGGELRAVIDRPFVRMTKHLRKNLCRAADLYEVMRIDEARQLLVQEEGVVNFLLDVYPALFNLRLAMADDAEAGAILPPEERIHYLKIIKEIRGRVCEFQSDRATQGQQLAGAILEHLMEADAALTDGFVAHAYHHVKQAAAGI